MTVIAWDGKIIAADKQASHCGLKREVTKLFISTKGNEVLGFSQDYENGLGLIEWYNEGAVRRDWPAWQTETSWGRLVVAGHKYLFCYEQLPFKQLYSVDPTAFGSGRDFALGAMAAGADAIRAVEIACRFSDSCGMGIDAYDLETMQKIR